MNKNLLLCFFSFLISQDGFSGTFTSNVPSGDWSSPSSWNFVADADGIPDSDDNVVIQAGHTITLNASAANYCRDLSVQGTISLSLNKILYLNGNYSVSGNEIGVGTIAFLPGTGTSISGANFGQNVRWTFAANSNRTILAGTTIVKAVTVGVSNTTLTNNGSFTVKDVFTHVGAVWIQGSNSFLSIKWPNFMSGRVFNASAPGNTVNLSYTGQAPISVGNSYHHLSIGPGNVSCALPTTITVNGNLTVNSALNLNNFDLHLKGNFTNSSSLFSAPSGSIFHCDGTSNQTLSSIGLITTSISNLNINNSSGVNISLGNFAVSNSLSVLNGNFNTGTFNLTLSSTPTSTAYIAPSNGTFSGSMIMQRHISSRVAGFSTMSSPSTGSTVQDWDNELLIVYATGGSSFPSVVGYSETLLDWEYVSSATEPLSPGKGFEVWLDDNGTYTSFTAATIDIRGTPNRGNISRSVTVDNDGWNLIGNPYAAHISFSDFRANAGVPMSDYFMYWDEAEDDYSFGGPGDEIAPHQGFWIEASSAGNVIFRETNKTTSNSSFFRSTQPGFFKLRLKSDGETNFTSNTNFVFEEGMSNAYEQGSDVTFKKVPHPNAPSLYSLSIDGKRLRLNKMEAENNLDLPLGFAVGVSGFYTISANELGLAQDAGFNCVVLEDKLTKTFTDLTEGNYRFYADGTSDERFVLHLSKDNSACNRNLVTSASSELQGISITHTEQGIFVNYDLEDEMNSVISVSNLLGQEIVSARSISISKGNIRVALPESFHGMFIVSVRQGDKMVTRKFFQP